MQQAQPLLQDAYGLISFPDTLCSIFISYIDRVWPRVPGCSFLDFVSQDALLREQFLRQGEEESSGKGTGLKIHLSILIQVKHSHFKSEETQSHISLQIGVQVFG
jgi:hypothetical protein